MAAKLDNDDLSASDEFRLVAACCAWPRTEERRAAVRAYARTALDWTHVLNVARRHRVEGLVHAALANAQVAPDAQIASQLRNLAGQITRRSLVLAVESHRLQSLLSDQGIANLVLKGAAVEILAYGALGMKSANDVDLLVAPSDAEKASATLLEAGYQRIQPNGLLPAQFQTWIALAKECAFFHEDLQVVVELHWRLVDGPVLLPEISVASAHQTLAITASISLRTLARAELFSYLCVHGAMHAWSRLKWLSDLAALLAHESPESIEALYRASQRLGAGLCPAQALLLCQRLWGTPLSPALEAELRERRVVSWLVDFALDVMAGGGDREIKQRRIATRILLSEVLLVGGGWKALAQIRYRSIGVHDRVYIPLPRYLHFLYPILRAPLWLWRRIHRR